MLTDHRGAPITGADGAALGHYEKAIGELNRYIGDPVATLDRAIAERPTFAMAHILKAQCLLSAAEKDLVPQARASATALRDLPLNERERAHAGALEAFLDGELDEASHRLEMIALDDPHDIVALQIGHLLDFYRGDARTLRDRIARAVPEWSDDLPNAHAVLGMYAFGLEEAGEYGRAEEAARRAIGLERRDGWAHHALAHVMEMTGRAEEGAATLAGGAEDWAPESFFAVHNWWHLALFRLEHDDVAGALELYDGAVRGGVSTVVLDMVDASALLWRLHLRGVALGARWEALADAWQPRVEDAFYAFNDVHALMALIGAGRADAIERLIAAMHRALEQPGSNAVMTRQVGLPLAEALLAFDRGRFGRSIELLLRLRPIAARFGGSHAQRDLLDLTLIEAARRDGRRTLLQRLANERLERKPASPLAHRYRASALAA
jgi:tetratricopeptide (TPR) repeat protein